MTRNAFEGRKDRQRVVGDVRQNQLISTFGIGSIVDFVHDTVMIAGLDDWKHTDKEQRIYNENLQSLTGVEYFVRPKTSDSTFASSKERMDTPSYAFPEKLYCPRCHMLIDVAEVQAKRDKKCFLQFGGKRCNMELVASRFVVVCENGHIDDFPYEWWVHRGEDCPSGTELPRIEMYNVDDRSDITSLNLRCTHCDARRSMSDAFLENAFISNGGLRCTCRHPHLPSDRAQKWGSCSAIMKTRLRSSSGIYFPVIASALSIPPWSQRAVQIIESIYSGLGYVSEDQLPQYINNILIPEIKEPLDVEDLLLAYRIVRERKASGIERGEKDIYLDEYRVLCKGTVDGDDEYSAKRVKCPDEFDRCFRQIVAVDKLTEVQALCGFTRLKPAAGFDRYDGRIVPLSSGPMNRLPASKLTGEGIFFEFDNDEILRWRSRVGARYNDMGEALEESYFSNERFSPTYVMLHTFAHLFIRYAAECCGYSTASIKEKIYSTFAPPGTNDEENMHGVLIYLASSDSEGSLGGLTGIAKNGAILKHVLRSMLRRALWCSADPLCIASTRQGYMSLNYAACHDCTLLPETSCEFRNVLLDRASIVGLPEDRDVGYFGEAAMEG